MITDGELGLVEDALGKAVASDVVLLSTASEHIIHSGGKRVRPRVVLLSYKAVGGKDIVWQVVHYDYAPVYRELEMAVAYQFMDLAIVGADGIGRVIPCAIIIPGEEDHAGTGKGFAFFELS